MSKPDPDNLNKERASWAGAAIDTFMSETGTDTGDALADLLADLMHWADENETSFEAELRRAQYHYGEETNSEETSDPRSLYVMERDDPTQQKSD